MPDDIKFNTRFLALNLTHNQLSKTFLIGSVYLPSNFPSSDLREGLNKILATACNYDGFILGGDLNSKSPTWGDNIENMNGRTLSNWLEDNVLNISRICDRSPSYPYGSSCLDHFLISSHLLNKDQPNFKISSLPSFSDHFPLKLVLKLEETDLVTSSLPSFFSFKNTNWTNFSRDLEESSVCLMPPVNRNLQNDEIDTLIANFTTTFNTFASDHSVRVEVKNHKAPISDKIKKFFRTK
ncbi:uncharacterized protein LOC142236317 [Haematobia irritans]|uniref:uncharacterized protein LOC142236317 n=1 Tax=Haematobia irritans TaxID=7368 RepID=UPI003F50ADD5